MSQPVNVKWSTTALSSRGYLQGTTINLPVFGLYADYPNQVALLLTFGDGSIQTLQQSIQTAAYTDPTGVYVSPTINKARAAGGTFGFNYFIMKSLIGPPVIIDTDGKLRWAIGAGTGTSDVYFANGQFITGSNSSLSTTLIEPDGTESPLQVNLPQPPLTSYHHNIDPGPNGLLADFNGTDSLGSSQLDILAEIVPFSNQPPVQTYDMAEILSAYMTSNGDDASAFVRPGIDWFHLNASTYDASDQSVIISSRENFLIKLDYATHDIIWIFGDPTKYWYTFPSLRAKALLLDDNTALYPVGQHAVSITSDGYVMVFNDGLGSTTQPPGEPAGITRTYSAVSVYSMNPGAMTAHQERSFDYGQTIFSEVCGSSYEMGQSYLVDFATADNLKQARLVGLDSNFNVVFDFQYPSPSPCGAAWNAIPVALEDMQIN